MDDLAYKIEYESQWNFPIDLPLKGKIEIIENYFIVTGKYKTKTIIPISTGLKTKEYKFIKLIHQDIFIVRLLPRDIVEADERTFPSYDQRKYSILSTSTGKQTECYDFIHFLYGNKFMVGNKRHLGVISSIGEVLCPTEFDILTFPVDGYVFAIKYIEPPSYLYPPKENFDNLYFWQLVCLGAIDKAKKEGNYKPQYDILLYDLEGRLSSPLTAAYHTTIDINEEIKKGMFLMTVDTNNNGLKSISVPNPSIFDKEFVQLINGEPSKSKYDNKNPQYWVDGGSPLSKLSYEKKENGCEIVYDNNGDVLYEEEERRWCDSYDSGYASDWASFASDCGFDFDDTNEIDPDSMLESLGH